MSNGDAEHDNGAALGEGCDHVALVYQGEVVSTYYSERGRLLQSSPRIRLQIAMHKVENNKRWIEVGYGARSKESKENQWAAN